MICSHFTFHFKHAPSLTIIDTLFREAAHQSCVVVSGSEGIVACRLLSGAPCLLHCRVNGAALAMWLRSPHPALPDCILYHCQRALAQHWRPTNPLLKLPGKLLDKMISCNDCLKAVPVYCLSYALTNNLNDIYFLYTVTELHCVTLTYSKKYLLILNVCGLVCPGRYIFVFI